MGVLLRRSACVGSAGGVLLGVFPVAGLPLLLWGSASEDLLNIRPRVLPGRQFLPTFLSF